MQSAYSHTCAFIHQEHLATYYKKKRAAEPKTESIARIKKSGLALYDTFAQVVHFLCEFVAKFLEEQFLAALLGVAET